MKTSMKTSIINYLELLRNNGLEYVSEDHIQLYLLFNFSFRLENVFYTLKGIYNEGFFEVVYLDSETYTMKPFKSADTRCLEGYKYYYKIKEVKRS